MLLGRRFNVSMFVDGVVLAALDRVKKNLGSLLNALEEAVILGTAGGRLLIRVMAKNLLAVGSLDLLFCGLESIL